MASSPMTPRTSRIMSLRYEIQAAREAEAQQQMFHTMAVPNGAPPTGVGTAGPQELTVPPAGPEQYMVSARSSEADEGEDYHNDILLGQLVQRGILTPERAELIPQLFAKYDLDGNGTIDVKELEFMLQSEGFLDGCEASLPAVAASIVAVDTNKNGFFEFAEFVALMGRLERYTPTQLLGVRGANFSISDDWPESFKVQGGGILDRAYGAGCAVKHPGSAEKYGAPHMVQPSMEQVPPGAVAAPTANVPIESGASAGGYLPYTIDPSESLGPDPAMSKS